MGWLHPGSEEATLRTVGIDHKISSSSKIAECVVLSVLLWFALMVLMPVPWKFNIVSTLMRSWLSQTALLLPIIITHVCCIVVIVIAVIFYLSRSRKLDASLLCAICIAVWESLDRNPVYALLISTAWIVYILCRGISTSSRNYIFFIWVIGIFIQIAVSLFAYFLQYQQFHTPGFGIRASGLYTNPNGFYPISIIASFLFLNLSFHRSKWRGIAVAIASLSIALTILTFSRSAWIGLAVGFIFIGVISRSKIVRCFFGCFAVALLIGSIVVRTHGSIMSPQNDRSLYGRTVIWKASIDAWKRHPWIGNGYAELTRSGIFIEDKDALRLTGLPAESKNLFMTISVSRGILGLLIYAIFLIYSFRSLIVNWNAGDGIDPLIRKTALYSLVALLTASLFDTPVFVGPDRTCATVILLLFISLAQDRNFPNNGNLLIV